MPYENDTTQASIDSAIASSIIEMYDMLNFLSYAKRPHNDCLLGEQTSSHCEEQRFKLATKQSTIKTHLSLSDF